MERTGSPFTVSSLRRGVLPLEEGLRLVRWRWRRMLVAWRWGAEALAGAPRLFGNAIPKAGSHLLHQVLQGFAAVGPFVVPGLPPVNRDPLNRKRSAAQMLAQLRAMRPGDIRYGYLGATPPFTQVLTQPGWATVFIVRDPRDAVVSEMHYIGERQTQHDYHPIFQTQLREPRQRLRALILGMQLPHSRLPSVEERYRKYLGWLDHPQVFTVRFEDLILRRRETLARLLDYVQRRGSWRLTLPREQALEALEAAIRPRRSGTFRKGQPGEWRQWFDADLKRLFKEHTGDLLIRLGYERDHDW